MATPDEGEGERPPASAGDGPAPPRTPGAQSAQPGAGLSALPSVRARALAFVSIVVAGLCGGLIGGSLVSLQCRGGCAAASAIGAVVGALVAAGGVAVVATLTLRAMGEWKRVREEDLFNEPRQGPP